MKKEWPVELRVFIQGTPGQRYLVYFSVLSNGNPITLGPFVSDKNNMIVLARSSIIDAIISFRRDFPMDYRGNVLTLPGTLAVDIQSKESIIRRAETIRLYYPEEAKSLTDMLDSDVSYLATERRILVNIYEGTRDVSINPGINPGN
jgi:hypothetical protein